MTSFDSGQPGPHVAITALVHGNELCGAWALLRLLERGIRPCRRLSLAFVNLAAFDAFDPGDPRASRYLDEDLNRVWSPATLDGPRRSHELDRARELRPLIENADFLLDIHSMQSGAPPLLLTGVTDKGRRLAGAMGFPACIVADDAGHRNGARIRDFGPLATPTARAPRFWSNAASIGPTQRRGGERRLPPVSRPGGGGAPAARPSGPPARAQAPACGGGDRSRHRRRRPLPLHPGVPGCEVIPDAGTVIAYDGALPIRTPYDQCVLIMPSRRLAPGFTAVRLGQFVA